MSEPKNMSRDKLKYLLSKYIYNTITKSELEELLREIQECDEKALNSLIDGFQDQQAATLKNLSSTFNQKRVFEKINNQIHHNQSETQKKFSFKLGFSIAAAILLIASFSFLWLKKENFTKEILSDINDIQLPNPNLALITLEDGTNLTVSNEYEDVLREEGIQLITDINGELIYKIKASKANTTTYQTFHSPKGISSRILLADGSTVWLNSDSKITYPTSFSADIRHVTLDGEAYFDIIHLNKRPFIVEANGTDIKVLGTEFNIATKKDTDKTYTTLVSGSVEVQTPNNKLQLKPGLQSITMPLSDHIETHTVDLREITAWKDGYFRFNDDDIGTVLSKIKAWYDIDDVEIQNNTSDRFSGSIMRTRKLSDLLSQLEKISNYKFKITEGGVIVM